jgi:hypothetical protein
MNPQQLTVKQHGWIVILDPAYSKWVSVLEDYVVLPILIYFSMMLPITTQHWSWP